MILSSLLAFIVILSVYKASLLEKEQLAARSELDFRAEEFTNLVTDRGRWLDQTTQVVQTALRANPQANPLDGVHLAGATDQVILSISNEENFVIGGAPTNELVAVRLQARQSTGTQGIFLFYQPEQVPALYYQRTFSQESTPVRLELVVLLTDIFSPARPVASNQYNLKIQSTGDGGMLGQDGLTPVTRTVEAGGSSWQLSVTPRIGWESLLAPYLNNLIWMSVITILLFDILGIVFLRRQEKLISQLNTQRQELQTELTVKEQTRQQLSMKETILSQASRQSHIGIWEYDVTHNKWFWSEELFQMLGLDPAEYKHENDGILSLVDPTDRGLAKTYWNRCIEQKTPVNFETRFQVKDGGWLNSHVNINSRFDSQGKLLAVWGLVQDISTRIQAADQLLRLNRALNMVRLCDLELVNARDENELMTRICRIIIEHGGYQLVSVGEAVDDADKSVRIISSEGANQEYLKAIKLRWDDSPEAAGPTGSAIKTGNVVISMNIQKDPGIYWKKEASRQNFHSVISLPLKLAGGKNGVLSVYSNQPEAFQHEEVDILQQLAGDISFGLAAVDAQREYHTAMESLQITEDKFFKVFQLSPDAIYILDNETRIFLDVNEGFEKITGYTRAQVFGKTPSELGLWLEQSDRKKFINMLHHDREIIDQPLQFKKFSGQTGIGLVSARIVTINKQENILCILRDISETVATTRALNQSEERNRLIAENMAETVWIIRRDLTINYVSPSVSAWLGYPADELTGMNFPSYLTESSRALFLDIVRLADQAIQANANQSTPGVMTMTFFAHDGREKSSEITMSGLKDNNGNLTSWMCVARDVTEQKEMEAALRSSEQRWQYALEGSGDGVWDFDIKSGFVYFSPQFYTLLGFSPTESWSTVDDWYSHISPVDADVIRQKIDSLLNGETREFMAEYRMIGAQGRTFWVLSRGKALLHDEEGKPVRLVGVLSDISWHREMIEALEKSEEQFRLLAERSTDVISRHDSEGHFLYISPACLPILGYDQKDLVGLRLMDQVHPEDRSMLQFVMSRLDIYQEIKPIQYRIRRKDGEYIWVESTARTLVDINTGNLQEVQATTRSITERVVAEIALRESEEKLRALFSQSTDGIVLIDEEGKIIEWSKGQERLTGISAPDAVGQPYPEVRIKYSPLKDRTIDLLCQIRANTEKILHTGSSTGHMEFVETEIERANGDLLTIQSSFFPIQTLHGYMAGSISHDITSIRKAEKAVQESEERLRFVTDNMMDVVCHIDQDRIIRYVSPSVHSSLGLDPALLIGTKIDPLVDSNDLASLLQAIEQSVANKDQSIQAEYRIRNGQGRLQWMESLVNLIYDEAGAYSGAVLGSRDITEKKKSNDALKDSEARYRTLAHNFPNGMVMLFDSNMCFTIADGTGLTHFELASEDLPGRNVGEVFPNEIAMILEPVFQSSLRGNTDVIEIHFNGRDLQVYTLPLLDTEGKITGGMMMTQDITDRKNAVLALSSRAQFLSSLNEITRVALENSSMESLVQQMADLLLMLFDSDDCFITAWNPETGETIPLAAAGSMRETYTEIHHSRSDQTLTASVLQLGQAMVIDDPEKSKYVSTDLASQFPSRTVLVLPLIGGGEKLGAAIIGFNTIHELLPDDISRAEQVASLIALGVFKQQLVDEIRLNNLELEKRVAERTEDLEAKNKELETFTYSVSHDLKAPLRGIEGYSRLLMEDHGKQLDPEGLEFLATIRQATSQMSRLIEDLLSYSRLERRLLKNDRVDLSTLIDNILRERQNEIKEKGVSVIVDVEPGRIQIDERALEQAMRNLIDNAIKFTSPDRKPVVEIQLKNIEGKYILSVQDNGIGFDMKYHEKIFDIFQRLHLAEDYPGTGIGLALVRKAMQRLGGRVWAESEPGAGSTFYLEFSGENTDD